ncbi:hypothetical protein [Proteiniborus sp. MB09-C3]|uniref:hypothetical protein n=1 Tax=Proteiniborus sp. MB09-C3 TaxID=3050072 RepID=UPI002553EF8E|nr:hypothetical protein [Proteiniborus sp. MB09-C3]WIV11051.1 hypothetical protein QO263_12915 [Proteiniborus sp. MB09-C3]
MSRLLRAMILNALIILILIGCSTSNSNGPDPEAILVDKGSFNDVILDMYPDKNFLELELESRKNESIEVRYSSGNTDITKEFLNYFKNLNIERIDDYDIPEEIPSREIYEIDFIEKDTYSKIKIHILSKEYLRIMSYIYIKKIDKEKNIVSYDEITDMSYFKVIDSILDLDYIERVFYSLSKEN